MPPKKLKTDAMTAYIPPADGSSPLLETNPWMLKEIAKHCDPESVLFISNALYNSFFSKKALKSNEIWQYWTERDCCPPIPEYHQQDIDINQAFPTVTAHTFEAAYGPGGLGENPLLPDLIAQEHNRLAAQIARMKTIIAKLKELRILDVTLSAELQTLIISEIPKIEAQKKYYSFTPQAMHLIHAFWTLVSKAFTIEIELIQCHNATVKLEDRVHWKDIYKNKREHRDQQIIAHMTYLRMTSSELVTLEKIKTLFKLIYPDTAAQISLSGMVNARLNGGTNFTDHITTILSSLKKPPKNPSNQMVASRQWAREVITNKLLPNLPTRMVNNVLLYRHNILNAGQTNSLVSRLTDNVHLSQLRLWNFILDEIRMMHPFDDDINPHLQEVIERFPDHAFNGLLFKFICTFLIEDKLQGNLSPDEEKKVLKVFNALFNNIPRFRNEVHRIVNNMTVFDLAHTIQSAALMGPLFAVVDLKLLKQNLVLAKSDKPFSHVLLELLRGFPLKSGQTVTQFDYIASLNASIYAERSEKNGNFLQFYKKLMQTQKVQLSKQTQAYNTWFISLLKKIILTLPPSEVFAELFGDAGLLELALKEKPTLLLIPIFDFLAREHLTQNQMCNVTAVLAKNIKQIKKIAGTLVVEAQLCDQLSRFLHEDFLIELAIAETKQYPSPFLSLCWKPLLQHISSLGRMRLAFIWHDLLYLNRLNPAVDESLLEFGDNVYISPDRIKSFVTQASLATGLNIFHIVASDFFKLLKVSSYFRNLHDALDAMSYLDKEGNTAFHRAAKALAFDELQSLINHFIRESEFTKVLLCKNNHNQSCMGMICDRFNVTQLTTLLGAFPASMKSRLIAETQALSALYQQLTVIPQISAGATQQGSLLGGPIPALSGVYQQISSTASPSAFFTTRPQQRRNEDDDNSLNDAMNEFLGFDEQDKRFLPFSDS